jgi:hypothetical protein
MRGNQTGRAETSGGVAEACRTKRGLKSRGTEEPGTAWRSGIEERRVVTGAEQGIEEQHRETSGKETGREE